MDNTGQDTSQNTQPGQGNGQNNASGLGGLFNYLYSSLSDQNPAEAQIMQQNPVAMQNFLSQALMNPNGVNVMGAVSGKEQNLMANPTASQSQDAALKDPAGSNPQSAVGGAIDGACSPGGGNYAGLCQQYADDITGSSQRYPTAFATWQAKQSQGQAHSGLDGMQPGDVVEFAPDSSNGGDGHAAVVDSNGDLQMATYNGVQTFSVNDWLNYSGQTPLGYYNPGGQGGNQ